jgi:quercetin dioxygenase-like cupin family protein
MSTRLTRWLAIVLIAAGMMGAPLASAQDSTGTPAAAPAVVREVLSQGEPAAAPGRVLQLVRFLIPAHAKLPVHTHPGMQTAWLESGVLQYTVVQGGPITITRAGAGEGTPGPIETLSAGQTTTFHAGDSWAEPEGMVHFAENASDEPVVILVASLLVEGAPAATIVNQATPTS